MLRGNGESDDSLDEAIEVEEVEVAKLPLAPSFLDMRWQQNLKFYVEHRPRT